MILGRRRDHARHGARALWATGLCLALSTASHAGWWGGHSGPDRLGLSTWNLEWLMTPATRQALGRQCVPRQPDSDTRALPCTPGRKPPPERNAADLQALSDHAQRLLNDAQIDLVALQEVDGPSAARQVFGRGWRVDCFTGRAHPQNVGFAIREGLPYRCHGDLTALDTDGSSRAGADLTLWPGTPHAVRVLAVHLKSGCFTGRLDRQFGPCQKLREQVPVIEQWIDARVREGVAFAVMGDFNRHLDVDARYEAGDDEAAPLNMVRAWSDDQPRGAVLWRATEGQPYRPCHRGDTHRRYIDDIFISASLARRFEHRRMDRLAYPDADEGLQLSDHCPLSWVLK